MVAALNALGGEVGSRENLRCLFHDDKHPSATLKQSDGKWFFSCHASSCSVMYDIWELKGQLSGRSAQEELKAYKKEILDEFDRVEKLSGVGKKTEQRREEVKEVVREREQYTKKGDGFDTLDSLIGHVLGYRAKKGERLTVERRHPYTDPASGVVPYCVFRLRDEVTGKKSYSQAYQLPNGRYVSSKPTDIGLLPLYNRGRVATADRILMVEGEWNVEAFTHVGLDGWAATTTPGGAGKSELCDLSPLAGKTVYLWADNDAFDEKLGRKPGEHHMKDVATRLLGLDPAPTVKIIRHDELDLPVKGDIVDYLKSYRTKEEKTIALKLVFQDAISTGTTQGLKEQILAIEAGTYKHIEFPDSPVLSSLSKALYPGTVTLVCAEPGAGKSFWVLEKAWKMHELGFKVKVLMLEEDHVYWQRRCLAQMAGRSEISDIDWIKTHVAVTKELFNECEERLESFMRRVEIAPSRPTLQWAAEWVAKAAAEGNEIIYVDPITAAANSDKAWLDDHEFLFASKEAMEHSGSRLVLTTHPRLDTKGKPSLAGLAGGAAYPRFSQTVFWLRKLEKEETNEIDPGDGNVGPMTYGREIQIRKARNGKGGGANIANILDKSSLTFYECGEVVDI